MRSQTLAVGDGIDDRQYWLHVPAAYDCSEPMPLLVDFHGTAANLPEEAYQTEALLAFAEDNGVIVARPRSRSAPFNGGEIYRWDQNTGDLPRNVTFAKNLVSDLAARYSIDPARVYASGFSSGSNMVAQFLGDPTSPFSGLAPIAGGLWSQMVLPSLANGPRIYAATGYRDYLWPFARSTAEKVIAAGLPAESLYVRRTNGGHDLYRWHFDELFAFLDGGARPDEGALAAGWTVAALPSPADINALAVDGADLVAAGAGGRVWRRTGSDWHLELERSDTDFTALCFGATNGFVGGSHSAAIHGGASWGGAITVPDFGGMFASTFINGASCRDDGSIVVVGYWTAATRASGTGAWSKFGIPNGFGYESQVAAVASSPGGGTVVAGYYDYIAEAPAASNAASMASHVVSTEWWNAVATIPGGTFWVAGDAGAIVKSTDNGATWTAQGSDTTENLYAIHFADANHGAAVGNNGTVVVTSDGGARWRRRDFGKDVYLGAVFVDATTITVAGEDGLIASSPR
jgi:predicted esterase